MIEASLMGQDPNLVTFYYADRIMPVAETDVLIVALGKTSSQSWRPAVKESILDYDMNVWQTITGPKGELWLNSQDAWPGVALVQNNIKRRFPNKQAWDFPPSSFDPRVFRDPLFPNVPLQIELDDVGFDPSKLTFPLTAATRDIVTSWDRPPLAMFDSSEFRKATDYLDHLVDRYKHLGSSKPPPHFTMNLWRMGSHSKAFALEDLLGQLSLLLGTTRSDVPANSAAVQKHTIERRDRIAQRVCRELAGVLSIPIGKGVRACYLAALRQVADLSKGSIFSPLMLAQVVKSAFRGFGLTPTTQLTPMPEEDFAALGTLLFLLGATVYGYKWGTLNQGMAWSTWSFDAVVSNSTSCSQDEFHPHCVLMKP
jgi:hypothetical protein